MMKTAFSSSLSSEQREVFEIVKAFAQQPAQQPAQQQAAGLYLVGGAVRDWLMGRPIGDLDFVVEGDAIAFAQALELEHGGALQKHERFRAATWTFLSLHTDFATARRETYARPAILPSVSPADIQQDLLRRDFTVNTLTLRLADETLLDPLHGQQDLRQQLIRALHSRSFVDDPTRILRAARYAARLGFAVEPDTRQWIAAGLPHVQDLSGERVKYDLELILALPEPESALARLGEWGVFKSLGIVVPDHEPLDRRFLLARHRLASGEWNLASLSLELPDVVHAIGWGALVYNLGQMSASRWLSLIPYSSEVREALVSLGVLSTLSSAMFTGSPSRQSSLLRSFDGLALLIGWLFDSDERKRQAMHAEWHTWRAIQPVTTGDDLRARRLPPGPRYRELLSRLRAAWLDGEIRSADEEQALLDQLLQ